MLEEPLRVEPDRFNSPRPQAVGVFFGVLCFFFFCVLCFLLVISIQLFEAMRNYTSLDVGDRHSSVQELPKHVFEAFPRSLWNYFSLATWCFPHLASSLNQSWFRFLIYIYTLFGNGLGIPMNYHEILPFRNTYCKKSAFSSISWTFHLAIELFVVVAKFWEQLPSINMAAHGFEIGKHFSISYIVG